MEGAKPLESRRSTASRSPAEKMPLAAEKTPVSGLSPGAGDATLKGTLAPILDSPDVQPSARDSDLPRACTRTRHARPSAAS